MSEPGLPIEEGLPQFCSPKATTTTGAASYSAEASSERRTSGSDTPSILVTGATGFVGSHVARLLASQGAVLRLLVRPASRKENIAELNADQAIGDLRDPLSLKRAMSGCEFVFHVAADYRLWTRNAADVQDMYRSNVEGTRAILQAAREAGVRRVVYTSSVATMGFRPALEFADENSPVSLSEMIGHYKRSKFLAEQVALEAGRMGADVVVVCPSTPVGEQDIKPTPTGRIIVDFLNRKFPAYVDTGLNLVDVVECARGHVAAMDKGRTGERYILGGENLSLKQILEKLAAITGIPAPTLKLPYAVALGFGVLDTCFTGFLLGREPRATIDAVRMGRKKMYVSSAKAERELGWSIVAVDGALRRAVGWFRSHDYVAA
ncbi:MAG TPA: hopanoid-associated sugar epimerase [Terriglobales bacterium]|nr:hopanoid-associated sugar epimerase [Terriglobales bacterium]